MARWPSTRASYVYATLLRIGWREVRQTSSHRRLMRPGWPPYIWAFGDREELGPPMLARIAKKRGLTPDDL